MLKFIVLKNFCNKSEIPQRFEIKTPRTDNKIDEQSFMKNSLKIHRICMFLHP